MAGGFVKQRGKSWYYVASYTDLDTGEYRREWVSPKRGGFVNTKRGAERALAARLESIEAGERPGQARLTVTEWVSRWITGRVRAKPSSRYNFRNALRLYITPHIGAIPIGELTATQVAEWHGKLLSGAPRTTIAPDGTHKTLQRPVSHATLHKAHDVLTWALNAAVQDRVLRVNVAAKRPPPSGPPAPPRTVWDESEQRRVLAVVADDAMWSAFVYVLLTTGLRVGEIVALRWEDVDLARSRLMVQQGVSWDEQRQPILSSPKSQTSIRSVTLPASCVEALRRYHESLRFARRATGIVFRRQNGDRLTSMMVTWKLTKIAVQADVPRLTAHGARHSHATQLMVEGVPLKVVQERMGHAAPGYTAQMYQAVSETMQEQAAQAIEDALNRANGEPDSERRKQNG